MDALVADDGRTVVRRGPFRFPSTVSRRHRHPRARSRRRLSRRAVRLPRHAPVAPLPALPRAVRSALPSTQSPWRLRSAGFSGVHLPIFHTARIAYPTGRAGLGFHTPLTCSDVNIPLSGLCTECNVLVFPVLARPLLTVLSSLPASVRDVSGHDFTTSTTPSRLDIGDGFRCRWHAGSAYPGSPPPGAGLPQEPRWRQAIRPNWLRCPNASIPSQST